MLSASLAMRNTVGVYEYLAAAAVFFGDHSKTLEIIVPVIIQNDQLVVFFKFRHELIVFLQLLAGGGDERIFRIFFTDVFFKNRYIADEFIEAVFRHFTKTVAERILQILFGDSGICESITYWNITLVEPFDGIADLLSAGIAA